MTSERAERRPAADVEGYSCVVGTDEEGRITQPNAVRRAFAE
jgi:hypothetical protein